MSNGSANNLVDLPVFTSEDSAELREAILQEVERERQRQMVLWGYEKHDDQHGPLKWLDLIITQLQQAESAFTNGDGSLDEYRKQLVQIAALSVAAIERCDRKQGGGT